MAKAFSASSIALFLALAAVVPLRAESRTEASNSKQNEDSKAGPKARLSEKEQRLLKAVNAYRDKKGLEPLKVDPTLMKVARNAAPHFSHCINGKWCWDRAHEAGFPGWASDDLAMGYESPEEAVDGWATSDGHAHQMRGDFKMNGQWRNYKFNRIGVGISGRKYIAVFGHADDEQKGEKKRETSG